MKMITEECIRQSSEEQCWTQRKSSMPKVLHINMKAVEAESNQY
jgi:hypothetical protein